MLQSRLLITAAVILAWALPSHMARSQRPPQQSSDLPDTSFTYRGQLLRLGEPVTDLVDFELTLWGGAEDGNRIGQPQWIIGQYVMDGLFSLTLDFGPEAFSGTEPRWLEITVLSSADTEPVTLTPRQRIAATPVALYALKSPVAETHTQGDDGGAVGAIGARSDSGAQGNTTGAPGPKGRDGLDGDGVTGRVGDDQQQNPQGSWVSNGNDIYYIAGNVGIGTSTPGNPLQTENASPNGTAIVGWARSSGSNLGVYGLANGATGTGVFGLAKSESSVVNYGGRFESRSSVGRGVYAIASDSGSSQSFGGWFQSNSSKGRGIQGFVSSATGKTYGGIFQSNSDEGYGLYAYTSSDSGSPYALYAKTNSATGYAGFFVGGRSYFQNNVGIGIINPSVPLHTTGNVTFASGWRLVETAGVSNIVGGYTLNVIENGLQGAVISGGGSELQPNTIVTDGSWATIGGGAGNTASSDSATIAGGFLNTASGSHGTVAGGYTNTASGTYSFTGGGYTNTASGSYATAGGGYGNTATQMYTTVGGGISNAASSAFCAISGGYLNQATAAAATVGGGQQNTASSSYATVSGGIGNSATNEEATVAGGYMNAATGAYATASGGSGNLSSGSASSVLGGSNGVASGSYSVACGGLSNEAIDFGAFAAGYRAKANHSGAFVWGDTSVAADVTSSRTYEWTIRSTGGVRFYTSTDLSTGVTLAAGGSGWAAVCDRNQKENFERLDTRDVLNKVCAIPMTTWNYKTQDDAIRHMGPMAQDFWHAFELGADELRINTIDADGVALAAIQGLNEIVKEQDAEIKDLKQRLARLEAVVAALAAADSE